MLFVSCLCWPGNTRAQDRLANSVSTRKFGEGVQSHVGTNIHTRFLCRFVRSHNVSTQYTSMVRETQNELAMINSARTVFVHNEDATMLDFVHAYNKLNDFNQITHVVGSHVDYFPGGPSFENRMCVVHKQLKGYGRGGGLFSDDYTWSIVDWKH